MFPYVNILACNKCIIMFITSCLDDFTFWYPIIYDSIVRNSYKTFLYSIINVVF